MPDLPWVPQNPYPIYGTINLPGAASVTVTALNLTTNESQTVTSESDSTYLVDAANFANGYTDGDLIRITILGISNVASIDLTNFPDGKLLDIGFGIFARSFVTNSKVYVI